MSKKDEDESMKRIGIGIVVMSAFVTALCIFAVWYAW